MRREMASPAHHEDADVELHFRSSRSDAILLLASGPTDESDYCLVTLDAGSIVVHSYVGSVETVLRVNKTSLCRRDHHELDADHDGRRHKAAPAASSAVQQQLQQTFGDLESHFVNITWSAGRVYLAVDRVYCDDAPVI